MIKLMNRQRARQMANAMTICFLIIHLSMILFFYQYSVRPMVYFNIFSVLFYLGILVVIHFEYYRFFVVTVYLEVIAHMSLAAFFTGWESGFQITLIGITILLYYTEYCGRIMKIPYVRATPLSLVCMAAYLILCALCHSNEPGYPLPDNVTFVLHIFWGVVTFCIMSYYLFTFVNLTAKSEELLSYEAVHDQLTGLPNRYYISEYLSDLSEKTSLEGHWIAMLDIDDFKQINDTYGHNCGDFILKELASILLNCGIDMQVCRWGGEEFILLGEFTGDLTQTIDELERLRREIMERKVVYEGNELQLTVTIGIAEYRVGSGLREWISAADQKMYFGKGNGKNRVVI